MASEWIGNLISGIAGIGAAGINYASQQSANATNIQLARENRDFYFQQWQRENAYNDPSAQMARLSRAGLNPALMYGEGAGGLPASASMSPVDAARVSAPQVDPFLLAQIANINADTEQKKVQSDKLNSDIRVNEGVIDLNKSVVLYNSALTNYTKAQQDKIVFECKALQSQVDLANSNIAKNSQEIQNLKADVYFRSVELSLKSKEIDALCDKYAAETGWTKEQTKYAGILAMAKVRNLNADSMLKAAQIELTQEQKLQVHKITENLSIQNAQMHWNLQNSYKYDEQDRELKQAQALTDIMDKMFGSTAQSAANSILKIENYNDYGKKMGLSLPLN